MENQPSKPIALKEWAVNIESLAQGKQIILMRKGGIHEETKEFQLQGETFYLFPTYLHQKKELLKDDYKPFLEQVTETWDKNSDEIVINYMAKVVEDIEILNEEKLESLFPHHIWTNNFAETKLHWKKDKPIHVLVTRIYQLSEPVVIKNIEEYNGCKSWVSLQGEIPNLKVEPMINDEKFDEKLQKLYEALK